MDAYSSLYTRYTRYSHGIINHMENLMVKGYAYCGLLTNAPLRMPWPTVASMLAATMLSVIYWKATCL